MAIFIDTNVPIYATGRPHPLKEPCRELLVLAGAQEGAFFTDAEVFQELLHRYLSLRNWSHGRRVFRQFGVLMGGRVEPIRVSDVEAAALMSETNSGLDARDLIHLAVMNRLGVTRIVSADTGFDRISGIERLDPARFSEWRDSVVEPL